MNEGGEWIIRTTGLFHPAHPPATIVQISEAKAKISSLKNLLSRPSLQIMMLVNVLDSFLGSVHPVEASLAVNMMVDILIWLCANPYWLNGVVRYFSRVNVEVVNAVEYRFKSLQTIGSRPSGVFLNILDCEAHIPGMLVKFSNVLNALQRNNRWEEEAEIAE
jgi:hypothetical protein